MSHRRDGRAKLLTYCLMKDDKTNLSFTRLFDNFNFILHSQVIWKPSTVEFEDRFDKYLDPNFFQHRIHWFSIFNSFMMVIFLVGLVSMILLRTLRKDYARYSKDDELDEMVSPHVLFSNDVQLYHVVWQSNLFYAAVVS